MRRIIVLLSLVVCFTAGLVAQQAPIIRHMTQAGTDTTIVILQPGELMERLQFQEAPQNEEPRVKSQEPRAESQGTIKKGVGFRVQVYSDNNPHSAKNNARSRQRAVASRCGKYRTYVSYAAPYWRTRVGDFVTEREANAAAAELRRLFPAFSKEIRVVRDRIQ